MSYFSASSSLATGFVNVLSIFFCKQKTAYELRISDWNSDVCSSDLIAARRAALGRAHRQHRRRWGGRGLPGKAIAASVVFVALPAGALFWQHGQPDVCRPVLGDRRVVTLADGSTVSLDAASQVRVAYSEPAPQPPLVRGAPKSVVEGRGGYGRLELGGRPPIKE